MKTIGTIILVLILTCNIATAQDTLYIYKSGMVVSKRAVAEIDSVIFYKAGTLGNTVKDIDGNVYHSVTIGTQVWMVENLKTTKYNDGSAIPLVTDATVWSKLTTPGYCWYKNDADNKNNYGALYNWYTVNTGKLAPKGWHVPSDNEWTTLEIYLQNNGFNYDGTIDIDNDRITNNKIAKSLASNTNWYPSSKEGAIGNTDNSAYRNKCGFTALPGGYRYDDGTFHSIGDVGSWWSSTELDAGNALYRDLIFDRSNMDRDYYYYDYYKSYGFSVRCVRD